MACGQLSLKIILAGPHYGKRFSFSLRILPFHIHQNIAGIVDWLVCTISLSSGQDRTKPYWTSIYDYLCVCLLVVKSHCLWTCQCNLQCLECSLLFFPPWSFTCWPSETPQRFCNSGQVGNELTTIINQSKETPYLSGILWMWKHMAHEFHLSHLENTLCHLCSSLFSVSCFSCNCFITWCKRASCSCTVFPNTTMSSKMLSFLHHHQRWHPWSRSFCLFNDIQLFELLEFFFN